METHEVTGDDKTTPEVRPFFRRISGLQKLAQLMVLGAIALAPQLARAKTPAEETSTNESAALAKAKKAVDKKYSLETTYGFTIHYPTDPALEKVLADNKYTGKQLKNLDEFNAALEKLERQMFKYKGYIDFPHFDIYFVKELFNEKHKRSAGFVQKEIVLDIEHIDKAVDHEINHILDQKDGRFEDDESWAKAHPEGMGAYTHPNGESALNADLPPNIRIPHFARTYGRDGGPDEDQATIADTIFDITEVIPWIVEKMIQGDDILQNKVTRETGCEFDRNLGVFTRLLSEQEYTQRFGTKGYEYYAKWSRDTNGQVRMDVAFWNNFIAQGRTYQQKIMTPNLPSS